MDPTTYCRDAARCLRRPRAGARHEPQRDPCVDVLPVLRRVQRRVLPAQQRQGAGAGHDPGLQRLAHRRVGRRRYPGRFIPLAIPPVWDPEALADEVRRVAAKGCRAMTMPELPHMQGLPSYHNLDYWTPFFTAASEEQVVMCLHIGQGFSAINLRPGRPDRQHDHPGDPGLDLGGPGSALGSGVQGIPRPEGGLVRGRNRLDPLLPEPVRPALLEPDLAGPRFRRQAPERHLSGALLGLLRHRSGSPEDPRRSSASTSSPGSATTPTRTRSSPMRRSSCTPSWSLPGAATRRSTRSHGRTHADSSVTSHSRTLTKGPRPWARCASWPAMSTPPSGPSTSGGTCTKPRPAENGLRSETDAPGQCYPRRRYTRAAHGSNRSSGSGGGG